MNKMLKMIDYKGKYFILCDSDATGDEYCGSIKYEDALKKDFIESHLEKCNYYGIPAYLGYDAELKKIYG